MKFLRQFLAENFEFRLEPNWILDLDHMTSRVQFQASTHASC